MFSLSNAQRPASGKAGRHVQLTMAEAGASTKALDGEILSPRSEARKEDGKGILLLAHSDAFSRATALLALAIAGGHAWISWVGANNPPKIDANTTVQVQVELPPDIVEAIRKSATKEAVPIPPLTFKIPRKVLEERKPSRFRWEDGRVYFD